MDAGVKTRPCGACNTARKWTSSRARYARVRCLPNSLKYRRSRGVTCHGHAPVTETVTCHGCIRTVTCHGWGRVARCAGGQLRLRHAPATDATPRNNATRLKKRLQPENNKPRNSLRVKLALNLRSQMSHCRRRQPLMRHMRQHVLPYSIGWSNDALKAGSVGYG